MLPARNLHGTLGTTNIGYTNPDRLEVEIQQDSVCQEVQYVRFQATGHTCNFLGLDEAEEGRGRRKRRVKAEGNPGARNGIEIILPAGPGRRNDGDRSSRACAAASVDAMELDNSMAGLPLRPLQAHRI